LARAETLTSHRASCTLGGMAKVLGLGGIFFKARDPKALTAWYAARLHFEVQPWGGAKLTQPGTAVWTPFPTDTKYFEPSTQPFMVNFRVDDLDALLSDLVASGVEVVPERMEEAFGRFAWIVDCEGNRVELWEPARGGGVSGET